MCVREKHELLWCKMLGRSANQTFFSPKRGENVQSRAFYRDVSVPLAQEVNSVL